MSIKTAGTAVIAAALLAGTSALALAQSSSQQPSPKEHNGSMSAPQHSQMQSPSRSTTGQSSSEKSSPSGSQAGHEEQGKSSSTQATPSRNGSQHSSDQMKSSSEKNAQGTRSSSEKNAQGTRSSSEKNAQGSTSPSERNAQSTSSPSRSTTASAPTGERVNLTSQQKTEIKTKIIDNHSAPRVSHVDFNVNVGVAVPSSVHLAPVPQVLVEIHPAWKTYRYFVYEEEVVIVDPHTNKIVEVIVLS